jgi:hypothetical protein
MDACTDLDASREIGSGSHTSGGATMHVNTFARLQGNATSDPIEITSPFSRYLPVIGLPLALRRTSQWFEIQMFRDPSYALT